MIFRCGFQLIERADIVVGIALQSTSNGTTGCSCKSVDEWGISVSAVGRYFECVTSMHGNSDESVGMGFLHEFHADHATGTETAPEARVFLANDATCEALVGHDEGTCGGIVTRIFVWQSIDC